MTKLQLLALLVNLGLTTQIFRSLRAANNSGGEDAMSAVVETFVFVGLLVVFDLVALIVHLWVK